MKLPFDPYYIPPLIAAALIGFLFYAAFNLSNPNSRFCEYRIYKQPDGTYQVWWVCRSRHLEGTFQTYDAAKAFQIKQVKELNEFGNHKPTGTQIK